MEKNNLQRKIADAIEKFVESNYGTSEINCPSWDIDSLAFDIANKLESEQMSKDTLDKWLDILNYWFEHIEDYAERYPDMAPMVKKFDKIIDEMYNVWKQK